MPRRPPSVASLKARKLAKRLARERAQRAAETRAANRRSAAARKGWRTRRKNLGLPPQPPRAAPARRVRVTLNIDADFLFGRFLSLVRGTIKPRDARERSLVRRLTAVHRRLHRRAGVILTVSGHWLDARTGTRHPMTFTRTLPRMWTLADVTRAIASAGNALLNDAYETLGDDADIVILVTGLRFDYRGRR